MEKKMIKGQDIKEYHNYLIREEKSRATVEKYLRDIRKYLCFAGGEITKEKALLWKKELVEKGYAIRSINSMLASINSLFHYFGMESCKVKSLKTQRQTYCPEEKELTKKEYLRLLRAAKDQPKLKLIIETICGTGIRVSELASFTVENVKKGRVEICCKGKIRTILISSKLRNMLLKYIKKNGIREGGVFLTRKGNPINRSNIWAQMKKLCAKARVKPEKVFPHNLRKLFARTFYTMEKDIAKLADLLGHSSIQTTRLYIMTTGREHLKKLDQLGLVV